MKGKVWHEKARLEDNTRERQNGTEQKSRREKGPREARSCGVIEGRMWALWVSMDAAVLLLGTWKISCEGI